MADTNRDAILIEILQTLKRNAQAIHDLTVDVEALKAIRKQEDMQLFAESTDKTTRELSYAFGLGLH